MSLVIPITIVSALFAGMLGVAWLIGRFIATGVDEHCDPYDERNL